MEVCVCGVDQPAHDELMHELARQNATFVGVSERKELVEK